MKKKVSTEQIIYGVKSQQSAAAFFSVPGDQWEEQLLQIFREEQMEV